MDPYLAYVERHSFRSLKISYQDDDHFIEYLPFHCVLLFILIVMMT